MFKVGDVVKAKSGGLPMTVGKVEDGHVECDWFDENDQHKKTRLAEHDLICHELKIDLHVHR